MSVHSQIRELRLYRLLIPLRKPFAHAAKVRDQADPIVVAVELADGTIGYGETLPRSYVTGESAETVLRFFRQWLPQELMTWRPASFPEALERIDAMPVVLPGEAVIAASRAGIELALLDAYSRHFRRPIGEAIGWLGLPGLGTPGSLNQVRYSGVLGGEDPRGLARNTRVMWWYGLRDFKLKVGYDTDPERIRAVARALGRSLGRTTSLRLDANGGWTPERARTVLRRVADLPISSVEQPLPPAADAHLACLREETGCEIMADESLVSMADARRLAAGRLVDRFNIRLSKNGGFLASLKLAHFARQQRIPCQLGCMVGETSILSAAGRHFIENVPGLTFVEGSYGPFLMRGDVTKPALRFGYGGRVKALPGLGWGVDVDPALLEQHATERIDLPL